MYDADCGVLLMTVELSVDRLDRVMRRLQRDLECCDRALVSCCGVTVAQSYALLALRELGAATMNEFATEMRLHGTTMTRMVDALIDKGMVERKSDPEDRRVVRVSLSAAGEEVAAQVQESKRGLLSAALADLPANEQNMVLQALERMADMLERLSERCCG
jgi:DNA-binding MarR family transcriptional regulator